MLAQGPSLLATTGGTVDNVLDSLLGGRAMQRASAQGQEALGNSTGNPVQELQEEGSHPEDLAADDTWCWAETSEGNVKAACWAASPPR